VIVARLSGWPGDLCIVRLPDVVCHVFQLPAVTADVPPKQKSGTSSRLKFDMPEARDYSRVFLKKKGEVPMNKAWMSRLYNNSVLDNWALPSN
jgi:hypothetical protein